MLALYHEINKKKQQIQHLNGLPSQTILSEKFKKHAAHLLQTKNHSRYEKLNATYIKRLTAHKQMISQTHSMTELKAAYVNMVSALGIDALQPMMQNLLAAISQQLDNMDEQPLEKYHVDILLHQCQSLESAALAAGYSTEVSQNKATIQVQKIVFVSKQLQQNNDTHDLMQDSTQLQNKQLHLLDNYSDDLQHHLDNKLNPITMPKMSNFLDHVLEKFQQPVTTVLTKPEQTAMDSLHEVQAKINSLAQYSSIESLEATKQQVSDLQHTLLPMTSPTAKALDALQPLQQAFTQATQDPQKPEDQTTALLKINKQVNLLNQHLESDATYTHISTQDLTALLDPLHSVNTRLEVAQANLHAAKSLILPEFVNRINDISAKLQTIQTKLQAFNPLIDDAGQNKLDVLTQQMTQLKTNNPYTQQQQQLEALQQSVQAKQDQFRSAPNISTAKLRLISEANACLSVMVAQQKQWVSPPLAKQLQQLKQIATQFSQCVITQDSAKNPDALQHQVMDALNQAQASQAAKIPKLGGTAPNIAVCSGAQVNCAFGDGPKNVNVLPLGNKAGGSKEIMSIINIIPYLNIPSFGMCKSLTNPLVASATAAAMGVLTPQSCIPVITPFTPGAIKTTTFNIPMVQQSNTSLCIWGPTITISKPGQEDLNIG